MRSHQIILVCSILFFGTTTQAQNLIPNWSFEDHTQCPDYWNEVERATGWHKSLNNNDPVAHTDYMNSCGTYNFDIPNNIIGSQSASTGTAYMFQVTMAPTVTTDYRENIYIQLIEPLEPGHDYDVHFKVSLADDCQNASNNQGVKFSTVPNFPIDGISQTYSSAIITDKLSWTEVSGSFTADSAYAYICVGNFFTDSQTLTSSPCPNCSSPLHGYYVDDVCVIPKYGGTGDCTLAYTPTGIDDLLNPGYGLFIHTIGPSETIQFTRPLLKNALLSVIDMEGRVLHQIPVAKGNIETDLYMEGMAPGVYMVRLEMGGQHRVKRFIHL